MENRLANIADFFKTLKKTNIRFNPRPFSNPMHMQLNQTMQTEPSVIVTQKDDFIDLHAEVVQKVDALLAQMESENTSSQTDMTNDIPKPINSSEIQPDTISSEFQNTMKIQ